MSEPTSISSGPSDEAGEATRLLITLRDAGASNTQATARLAELLYPELRAIASRHMRRERDGHTLQPTAVAHEAVMRLIDQSRIEWQDRAHFLGIAARVMRQILVEHARRHRAAKRGGGADRITLDDGLLPRTDPSFDLIVLDDILTRLASIDPRGARVAELRIFGGMTVQETAVELGVSPRTVNTDWTAARLWLARALAT